MPRRGFTLVEVMLATGLSAIILTGVLSSFLFLGRSGANMQAYNDMEAQSRIGLEKFAEDVRQASAITWNSSNSVTMIVNAANITYTFDSGTGILSKQDPSGTTNLITGASYSPGMTSCFAAYDITGNTLSLTSANLANANLSTKQLQLSLKLSRTGSTRATTTNNVLSSRYILRNKPVTA